MYAPNKSLSTNLFVGQSITAKRLDTVTDFMRNFNTNTVKVTGSAMFSSVNAATMRNVQINNRGGSIIGSRTETTQNIFYLLLYLKNNGIILFVVQSRELL